VVVNYASSSAAAEQVVAESWRGGGSAIALGADVSKPEQVDALNAVMEKWNRVDIKQCWDYPRYLVITDEARDWQAVIDLNLTGVFL